MYEISFDGIYQTRWQYSQHMIQTGGLDPRTRKRDAMKTHEQGITCARGDR